MTPLDGSDPRGRVRPEQRVSRRQPCELCGGAKFCLRLDDGSLFCREVAEGGQWTDAFLGGYLHQPTPGRPVVRRPCQGTEPDIATTDPDTQDAIYALLLALCPLTDFHRTLLRGPGHGLTDAQADRYGSLPDDDVMRRAAIEALVRRHGTAALLGTPGFRLTEQGHVDFAPLAGILMPRRDLQGHFTGFQVRSDNPHATQRYLWLSCSQDGGPSCGVSAHVAWPATPDPTKAHLIGVVEGIKKADVLADRLGYPVIGIVGVGTWRAAEAVLEELAESERGAALTTCVIMLDRDLKPRAIADVERSRQRLAAAAVALGYAVRIAAWSPDLAKGPDDLLLAGHDFTLDRYRPADSSDPAGEGASRCRQREEIIATQRAELADCKAQLATREALFNHRVFPFNAQVVLNDFLTSYGYRFGQKLPDEMPCSLYRADDDIKDRVRIGVSGYEDGRKLLKAMGLIRCEKLPSRQHRGREWGRWGLVPEKVNAFWAELPHLTSLPALDQQEAETTQKREEALQRAIAEEKPTRQVVVALKKEVAQERHDKQQAVYQLQAVSYERDHALEQAEALAQERDRAITEAQRIVHDHQQPKLVCRGCGTKIDPADWRCDDCRDRDRERGGGEDLSLKNKLKSTTQDTLPFSSPSGFDVTLKSSPNGPPGEPTRPEQRPAPQASDADDEGREVDWV